MDFKTGMELKRANLMEKHWQDIGGIVVDVQSLLMDVARLNEHNLKPREQQRLLNVTRSAALVACHALAPVKEALNDETRRYYTMDASNFMTVDEVKVAITRNDTDEL